MNCWVIIHCLEAGCKEDQITSAQREWFIFVQLTDKQWIITQQFTHWSWSISILTHNKRRKHIRSLQLLPTFCHCTEELPPILRLRRIRLHVIITSFKRKNDVTPSSAMNDVIFQWRQLSHTLAVNYCPIYHSLLPLALKARCVRITGWLRQWRCSSPHKSSYLFLDKGQVVKHLKQSKHSVLVWTRLAFKKA